MYYSKETKTFFDGLNYEITPKTICRNRTIYCLNWYSRKAIFYKNFFYILSVINIAAPLISSLLTTYFEMNIIGATLSALTSFSASLLALFNVRDKWTNYRSATEYIKNQYILYLANAAPYNVDACHTLYLATIEEYMVKVHSHWYHTQTSDEK